MKKIAMLAVLATASLASGCASIVGGHNQVVSVEAKHKGQQISGANCALVNPKGTFFVTTPGTVTVQRSYDDLSVKCEKDGMQPGVLAVKSSTKPMAFGNIIFGGVIGAAVDVGSGAAYDYPTLISVIMGESLTQAPSAQPAEPIKTPVAQN